MASTQSTPGPMETSMRAKLTEMLQPSQLEIRNDSWKHSNHAAMLAEDGDKRETHFFIHVVSDQFTGKTTLQRHRIVYSAISEELAQGLHALSLMTKTTTEMQTSKSGTELE